MFLAFLGALCALSACVLPTWYVELTHTRSGFNGKDEAILTKEWGLFSFCDTSEYLDAGDLDYYACSTSFCRSHFSESKDVDFIEDMAIDPSAVGCYERDVVCGACRDCVAGTYEQCTDPNPFEENPAYAMNECCADGHYSDLFCESSDCDDDCRATCAAAASTRAVFEVSGGLVGACTFFAFASVACILLGYAVVWKQAWSARLKGKAELGPKFFLVAAVAAAIAFILGLAAVITFASGCGCEAMKTGEFYGTGSSFHDDDVYHSCELASAPENYWCVVATNSATFTNSNSNYEYLDDDATVEKSMGTGTAFSFGVCAAVFELLIAAALAVVLRNPDGLKASGSVASAQDVGLGDAMKEALARNAAKALEGASDEVKKIAKRPVKVSRNT